MSLQLLNCQKKKKYKLSGHFWLKTPPKKKNDTVSMDNFCPKLQFKKYDELLDYFSNNQQVSYNDWVPFLVTTKVKLVLPSHV